MVSITVLCDINLLHSTLTLNGQTNKNLLNTAPPWYILFYDVSHLQYLFIIRTHKISSRSQMPISSHTDPSCYFAFSLFKKFRWLILYTSTMQRIVIFYTYCGHLCVQDVWSVQSFSLIVNWTNQLSTLIYNNVQCKTFLISYVCLVLA